MTSLACIELMKAAAPTPELRVRAIRAFQSFNTLPFDRALLLERCVAAQQPTAALYRVACKRLLFNLASNPALLGVPDEELVDMSDERMASGTIVERVQQQERQRHQAYVDMLKEKRDAVENLADQKDSVLHCRRCGSSNLHFVQLQTRSADEPMTCFLTCNACHNKWRMS